MPVDLNEAIQRIKAAGTNNVRVVPMTGQHCINGQFQIEVKENSGWVPIATGLYKSVAEDIIKQATSKLILG